MNERGPGAYVVPPSLPFRLCPFLTLTLRTAQQERGEDLGEEFLDDCTATSSGEVAPETAATEESVDLTVEAEASPAAEASPVKNPKDFHAALLYHTETYKCFVKDTVDRLLIHNPTPAQKAAVCREHLKSLIDISVGLQRYLFPRSETSADLDVDGDLAIYEDIQQTVTTIARKRKAAGAQLQCYETNILTQQAMLKKQTTERELAARRGVDQTTAQMHARHATAAELARLQMLKDDATKRWARSPAKLDAYHGLLQECKSSSILRVTLDALP